MNILLADPDSIFVDEIIESWNIQDVSLTTVNKSEKLIQATKEAHYDAVFLSSDCVIIDDLDIISYIKEHQPGVQIILMTHSPNDVNYKYFSQREISTIIEKPLHSSQIESIARKLKTEADTFQNYRLMGEYALDDLLGSSPAMKKITKLLSKVAPTTSSVLITGESGTGKEFIAQNIHQQSKRHRKPFITVNCGAIPENLVESELFGSKKGSYTGAIADKKGLFEEADGGTLFLDEVAELPATAQVKLLRFLQEKEIRRVGDSVTKKIDVRIIAATNRNVHDEVDNGKFREDLFYRLNTFQIKLPPLRERKDTIVNLIKFFAKKEMQEQEKEILDISKAAQVALISYDYPGNIRELSHAIEHAMVLSEEGIIRLQDLPEEIQPFGETKPSALIANSSILDDNELISNIDDDLSFEVKTLAQIEKEYIIKVLDKLDNNQSEAAKQLGISRSTLWRKLQND